MIANINDTNFTLPEVAFEFFGKIEENLIDSATSKYQQTVEAKKPLLKQNVTVQNCITHYSYSSTEPLTIVMIPKFSPEDAPIKVN